MRDESNKRKKLQPHKFHETLNNMSIDRDNRMKNNNNTKVAPRKFEMAEITVR